MRQIFSMHFTALSASQVSKIIVSTVLTFLVITASCSNSLDDLADIQINESTNTVETKLTSHISEEDALDIANKVLNSSTRTYSVFTKPSLEYVVDDKSTRSTAISDTIAYIINYPNNAGFVIVSTTRNVYPVLGFSDSGNFSLENENAKINFIDKIADYLQEAPTDTIYNITNHDFDGCYEVSPAVQITLGQGSPWDKYIIQEHPKSPVGCVAVATALVMSHAKEQITYHNSVYQLKTIITAINAGPSGTSANAPKRIVGGNPSLTPIYKYEQAVDSMAKMLYWIGKDVDMEYGLYVSLAYSSDAYLLCKSLGYSIPSGYVAFDINKVTQYIKDNHIVYLSGSEIGNSYGHAWVSDGCYFCVDYDDRTQIIETYIHCDWGWGGYGNGYFSGSVFEVLGKSYKPNAYFAVKREW